MPVLYTMSDDTTWIFPAKYWDEEKQYGFYVRSTKQRDQRVIEEHLHLVYGFEEVQYIAPEQFALLDASSRG